MMKFIGTHDRIFPWLVTGCVYDVTLRKELFSKGIIASIEGHSCPYSSMEAFKSNWEEMAEYIIYWSGIGAELIELSKTTPPWLWPKRIREKRLKERIVRCRDCKFAGALEGSTTMLNCMGRLATTWDYYNDEPQDNPVEPDGYCAWGERSVE